jgi:acyl dehydratase
VIPPTVVTTGLSLSSDLVGRRDGPLSHAIDARWLMAYAAGVGETDARYYDTLDAAGPAAHPIFSVCYEWPLAVSLRAATISEEIARVGVHALHDLTIHRPPRAGDTLLTTASIAAVIRRPAGALVVVRFDTVDADGRPVTTTAHGSIYRGVAVVGPDRGPAPAVPDLNAIPGWSPAASVRVDVPVQLAHVYTECARIWNPIHTDAAIAKRAGLPAIILHGTATLALAVSRVLACLALEPRRLKRVTCRFTGMVRLPSTFTVRMSAPLEPDEPSQSGADQSPQCEPEPAGRGAAAWGLGMDEPAVLAPGGPGTARIDASSLVHFDVVNEDGRPVLSRGALYL